MEHESALTAALRQFEVAEANLVKLERLWSEMRRLIPGGINFTESPDYENKCLAYQSILPNLPAIDGKKPSTIPWELNTIAQSRFDANEVGEIESHVSVEEGINAPARELREYRFLLNQKRRELTRDSLVNLIDLVDAHIRSIKKGIEQAPKEPSTMSGDDWDKLQTHIAEIDALLGSSTERSPSWSDLHRHLRFAELHDFNDIEQRDWPAVKGSIQKNMYGANEPIPMQIVDLSDLVKKKPSGPVTRELHWERLTPEQFERLVYSLISAEQGYENPQWLTQTNAPDRGRDLSVDRIVRDSLGGVFRYRAIIQCKHWLNQSVSVSDVETLKGQMKLWDSPRVDIHIIATSGRFTTDAVDLIEKYNKSDQALRIEMWPNSRLETLLAERPHLIAEFGLR